MQAKIVYITCPDLDTAREIGRAMVEAKLAACANILPAMESIYFWKETLQTDHEAVLLLKTTAEAVPQLVARVADLHPYDLPAIVALPIEQGYPPYLDWIFREINPE